MASNYTENYNLCQWEATDQVLRTEFNEDNTKVDTALNGLSTQLGTKASQTALDTLAATVSKKADQSALTATANTIPKIVVGSYVGDGKLERKISLSFTPKAVYLCPSHGATFINAYNGDRYYWGGLAVQGSPLKWIDYPTADITFLKIETNGFSVSYYAGGNHNSSSNTQDMIYHYLAIG